MNCKKCNKELTPQEIEQGFCENCYEETGDKCPKCGDKVKGEGMCGNCAK